MSKIETRYLSIPADEANLRDFIARAERDLAGQVAGLTATWPAFRADLARALALARRALARGEGGPR